MNAESLANEPSPQRLRPMKAMLLTEYGKLAVTHVSVPAYSADEVLVRVHACGICGSDVHGFDGSTGRRIPPVIMGHEAAGVIAEVGRDVTGWLPGKRVTFDSTLWCGACAFCRRGEVNLCENRQVLGVSCSEYRRNGAFAEYVAVPSRVLYQIPETVSFEAAAFAEPVAVAVHAVAQTPLDADAAVAVIGSGMIGLLIVQVLKARGCRRIVAVDVAEDRLALALKVGAHQAIRPDALKDKPFAQELGLDVVFEVVGRSDTVNLALACVRKGGSVTLVGNLDPLIEFPLQAVVTRQLSVRGSCASAGEFAASLDLIAEGKVDVSVCTSAVAPLEEGPRWFERLHAREKGLMKVILQP